MIGILNYIVNGIKHFGQEYYVESIDNIAYEAVQKYIKEQAEDLRRRFKEYRFVSGPVTMLATPPFGASSNIVLWRANIKPPVEMVVTD